jgi:hypothetical protein
MPNKKVYYQGCISNSWEMCYYMECPEKNNCPQFLEYDKNFKESYEKERAIKNDIDNG